MTRTKARGPILELLDKWDTHACTYDAAGGRRVRALCGALILYREHTNTPTCEVCRVELARRNAELGPA